MGRDSAWNGGETQTHSHVLTSSWNGITQSGAKWWAFFLSVVPSFSSDLFPASTLYSHPWHVVIKWVLLEFRSWPGLQEAAVPSHQTPPNFNFFLYHPSITSHPFLHQQIPPFLFHAGWIVSVSFNFMWTPHSILLPYSPLCSTRYDNQLAERVMVKWKRGHKHEMKTWLIHEKKSFLNRCQEEDEHLDLTI